MSVTSVRSLAELAQVSVAAYADILTDAGMVVSLQGPASFTLAQAREFVEKYEFVDQQPNDATGFSATVFRERATGKLIFAVRGTEIPGDISRDLIAADILHIGIAGYSKDQATSMYRYWRRLTTAGGQAVAYTEGEISQLYAVSKGLTGLVFDTSALDYLNFRGAVLADRGVDAGQPAGTPLIAPTAVVDVTGHSLGGHLAMLFARFFPNNAGEVVTLNAPGFLPNSALLTALGFPPPANDRITRIEADGDGISGIGSTGFWPGSSVRIAQENESGAAAAISSNHSSLNGADALAVMSVFARLDPMRANDVVGLSNVLRGAA